MKLKIRLKWVEILGIILLTHSFVFAQSSGQVIANYFSTGCKLIEIDAQQNQYITGFFEEEIQLGDYIFNAKEGKYFIACFRPNQSVAWAIQLQHAPKDILLVKDQLYILGQFRGKNVLGGQELTATQGFVVYLANLRAQEGTFRWIKRFASSMDAFAGGLASDSLDNLLVAGSYNGVLQLGDTLLYEKQSKNIYFAKFNSEGKFLWARQANGGNSPLTGIYFRAIKIDKQQQIYLTGSISGIAYFGQNTISSSQEYFNGEGSMYATDVFLAKYSPKGEIIWVKSIAQHAEVQDMTTDEAGNAFLTGFFKGSVNMGNHQKLGVAVFDKDESIKSTLDTTQHPSEQMFLAKYSALGNLIWVRQADKGTSRGKHLAWNPQKNRITVLGFFEKEIQISHQNFQSPHLDIFLASYEANGKFVEASRFWGVGEELADIALDNRHIYLTGKFKKRLLSDQIELQTQSLGTSGFVIKIYQK